jgi:hypothetical protein
LYVALQMYCFYCIFPFQQEQEQVLYFYFAIILKASCKRLVASFFATLIHYWSRFEPSFKKLDMDTQLWTKCTGFPPHLKLISRCLEVLYCTLSSSFCLTNPFIFQKF